MADNIAETSVEYSNVTALAEDLISAPSVTPASGLVFDRLEAMLEPLGFDVHRFTAGDPPDGPVENMFAIRKGGKNARHFAFAGHLDVVPPGEGWHSAPFAPEIRGDLLYGRGAVDMKGAIAAMVSAVAGISPEEGTISFIITGDEEGPAIHGTRALIELIRERDEVPELCLVGEPTSVHHLGDTMKIGRRGSVNIWLEAEGTQGHVAYPHLADNPISRLVALLSDIDAIHLDDGTEWFQPSNIEITDLEVGNPAHNVIPAWAGARISVRFNDLLTGDEVSDIITAAAKQRDCTARPVISGEPFLTPPGDFSAMIADAIKDETGSEPELSTSGGTSDARFLKDLCPVIEFGLCNATMHKRDEAVATADIEALARIYARITMAALSR